MITQPGLARAALAASSHSSNAFRKHEASVERPFPTFAAASKLLLRLAAMVPALAQLRCQTAPTFRGPAHSSLCPGAGAATAHGHTGRAISPPGAAQSPRSGWLDPASCPRPDCRPMPDTRRHHAQGRAGRLFPRTMDHLIGRTAAQKQRNRTTHCFDAHPA